MLERAYDILEPYFCRDVLPANGHGLLATPEQWNKLLDSLPTAAKETVGVNLKKKWAIAMETDRELSPEDKWKQLLQHLRVKFDLPDDHHINDSNTMTSSNKRPKLSVSVGETDKDKRRVAVWPMEVVFQHTYPRLDINVSKMQNHLLKSPFCVHPKTGRVCVPIHVPTIDVFDPFAVPTLPQLVQELDQYHATAASTSTDAVNSGDRDDDDKTVEYEWQKTSLKSYFEDFQKNFLRPMQSEWQRKKRDQVEQDAALRGDF
jgi:DNA primase small subunit